MTSYPDIETHNRKSKAAFHWIVGLLREHDITFEVAGGLAARAYGSKRQLADIDIDVDAKGFERLIELTKEHCVFGPERYQDKNWDLRLMTLRYDNQLIDIVDRSDAKLFNVEDKKWEPYRSYQREAVERKIFDMIVPVESRTDLIWNKTALHRRVDQEDLKEMVH